MLPFACIVSRQVLLTSGIENGGDETAGHVLGGEVLDKSFRTARRRVRAID